MLVMPGSLGGGITRIAPDDKKRHEMQEGALTLLVKLNALLCISCIYYAPSCSNVYYMHTTLLAYRFIYFHFVARSRNTAAEIAALNANTQHNLHYVGAVGPKFQLSQNEAISLT